MNNKIKKRKKKCTPHSPGSVGAGGQHGWVLARAFWVAD
jgi:hypothetical protein